VLSPPARFFVRSHIQSSAVCFIAVPFHRKEHTVKSNLRLVVLGAFFVAGSISTTWAQAQDSNRSLTNTNSPVIYACYNKENGNLRRVGDNDDCRKNEVLLTWNVRGPQGPPGPAGQTGAQGMPGPKGEKGDMGVAGPQGTQGQQGSQGPQGYSLKTFLDGSASFPPGCGAAGGLVLIVVDAEGKEVVGTSPQYVCNGLQGIQGPQGAQGPQGPPGAQGSGSTPGFYTRTIGPRATNINGVTTVEASCFAGDVMVGGGYSGNLNLNIFESAPSPPDKWKVSVLNPTSTQYGLSVYVVCADLTP
jgi:Collagen triple helix repeat (20 copies)